MTYSDIRNQLEVSPIESSRPQWPWSLALINKSRKINGPLHCSCCTVELSGSCYKTCETKIPQRNTEKKPNITLVVIDWLGTNVALILSKGVIKALVSLSPTRSHTYQKPSWCPDLMMTIFSPFTGWLSYGVFLWMLSFLVCTANLLSGANKETLTLMMMMMMRSKTWHDKNMSTTHREFWMS